MARRRIGRTGSKSGGFALLGLLVILTMGTLYFFLDQLTPTLVDAIRQKKTEAALNTAREAILAYAMRYRDVQAVQGDKGRMYGYLPMPDLGSTRNQNCGGSEGCEANTPTGVTYVDGMVPTLVGRLPWRSLGIEPLRDGHGECLWLIVASPFLAKNSTTTPSVADPPRMNWDTLGQFDLVTADGSSSLSSVLAAANAHQRPVAVIYAPGPRLSAEDGGLGQNRERASNGDDTTECGGNYDARNYLDPWTAGALGITNYLGGTNQASGSVGTASRGDDPDTPKPLLVSGKLFRSGTLYFGSGCPDCVLLANDIGLPVTSADVFGSIRASSSFRSDIDTLVSAMGTCLDGSASLAPLAMLNTPDLTRGKVPNAANACSSANQPLGYFDHYRENVLVAAANDIGACKSDYSTAGNCLDVAVQDTVQNTVARKKCHGVLIFSGQRGPGQLRASSEQRNTPENYLEGANLLSFTTANQWSYHGTRQFVAAAGATPAHRDVVRCIPEAGYSIENPTGAAFVGIRNPALTAYGGQLANYDITSRTISLGLQRTSASFPTGMQNDLYGCAWQVDTHALGGGLRSYFSFRINDALNSLATTPLDGFTFALVDGDVNGVTACGAARQHLGYSGNNLDTPSIRGPKIGIEVDLRRNFSGSGFNPSGSNTLTNGRNDPNYTGGHVGIVYWGGDANIATTTGLASCQAPRVVVGGACYLPPVEDDNVHGYPATVAACRPAPANPVAPAVPTLASGVYKLDPNLSAVPTNQTFHVRVEITRSPPTASAPPLPAVRAAATGNINLAAPGATLDGVSLERNDRILLIRQTNPQENGVYVWNAADSGMARAEDFDTATELAGAIVAVADGIVLGGSTWRQAALNPTVDSDPQYWAELRVRVASQTNLDLAQPGASIDNIPLRAGDRVLLKGQAIASENGIYLWNAATSPLIRATDADTAAKRIGMTLQVSEGSIARSWWRSADGTNWARQSVRVATQSNIDIDSPGATLDGCTVMTANDRVLVRAQNDARKNGIYVWNGAATSMTRAADADQASELAAAITHVQEGSDVDRAFRQTSLGANDTLDSQTVQWTPLDTAVTPNFTVQAWILPDSLTDANRIAAMKDTSRAMSSLDASFTPHLRDTPAIHQAFRRGRLGFTVGQSTSRNDQTVVISNLFTTWIQ